MSEKTRVMSWNVNGIKARWPRLSELLRSEQPDVLCLQETRCTDKCFPRKQLHELGYHAQHSPGYDGNGGVAMLVRSDHRVRGRNLVLGRSRGIGEGRWLEVNLKGLTIGTVYVPAGPLRMERDDSAKRGFLAALARQACEQQDRPLLIAGDFNIAPADIDVYEPAWLEGSSHTAPGERTDLREILEQGGMVDAYRHLHPYDSGFTCWDQREGHYARDYGLRIDLMLVSSKMADHVASCGVAHPYRQGRRPSNHAPVELTIDNLQECVRNVRSVKTFARPKLVGLPSLADAKLAAANAPVATQSQTMTEQAPRSGLGNVIELRPTVERSQVEELALAA